MKKGYRACKCKGPGFCERYQRIMPEEHWKLCQTSDRHRMLFDEQAGNHDFGMIMKRGTEKFRETVAKLTQTNKGKKMTNIVDAQKAITELQQQGINVNDLDKAKEKGLGDTIERVLTKFGLTKKLMSDLAGRTCGCNSRKQWLNKLLPYSKE